MATDPQDIIDAIDAAILDMMSGGGAQKISIGGKDVEFFDLDALRQARDTYSAIAGGNSGKLPFTVFHARPDGIT